MNRSVLDVAAHKISRHEESEIATPNPISACAARSSSLRG
jgi:hypothetical protein